MDNLLEYALVGFEVDLRQREVPQFRGAVVNLIGREYEEFHNHNNEETDHRVFHYRYPVIQYRTKRGKAHVFAMQEGLELLQPLLLSNGKEISLNGRKVELSICDLHKDAWKLKELNVPQSYRIRNWLALNQSNYLNYKKMTGIVERAQLLERMMVNHIVSFAKAVAWKWEKRLEVKLTDIRRAEVVYLRKTPLVSFEVDFEANVSLPSGLGLGKSVSHGYGILQRR